MSLLFSGYAGATSRPTVTINVEEIQQRQQYFENATNIIGILTSEIVLQKGNPQAALIAYLTMLERTQDRAVADRAFDLALAMNDLPTAQKVLNKWKQFEPKPSAKQKQAQWKLDLLQNKPEAWQNLSDAFGEISDADAARAFFVIAGFADSRGKAVGSDYKTLKKIAKNYPDIPESAFCLAVFAYEAGDKTNTVAHLQRLAELVPEPTTEIEYFFAVMLKERPDYLDLFYKKANKNLGVGWAQYQVELLAGANKTEEAYQTILGLLQKDTARADLYLQAGYLAQKLKKPFEESLDLYTKAYQLGGATQSRALLLIGALYYEDKKTEEATQWLNKITDKASIFDRNIFLTWAALDKKDAVLAQKLINEAKANYQKSNFFSVDDLENAQLGVYRLEKKEKVYIELVNRMIKEAKTEKRKDELLLNRSFYQSDIMGKPELAIETLKTLLVKEPDNIDYLNSLGYTLLSIKGNEQEGYSLIKKAYDQDPESAAINDSLGWALFKIGKVEDALSYLEFAFANMPNAEVAAHLGEVLWSLGREEEAKAIWQQGMQEDNSDKVLLETRKRFGVK